MSLRLRSDSPKFAAFVSGVLESRARTSKRVSALALKIAQMVSAYADKAVIAYNRKFDSLETKLLRVSTASSIAATDIKALFSLKMAYDRIVKFHSCQMPTGIFCRDQLGVKLGSK